MHNEMSDGPKPPEENGRRARIRAAAETSKNSGQLTPPDLSCMTEDERKKMTEGVAELLMAMRPDAPQSLFEAAMDTFTGMGAHPVGHALNGMLWSGVQAALVTQGQPPHDIPDAMIVIAPEAGEELTEADMDICEMISEMLRSTMAGAHASAVETWGNWVDRVGNDWDLYVKGIVATIAQVLFMAHATLEKDEAASELMGTNVWTFRPHECDHDHSGE